LASSLTAKQQRFIEEYTVDFNGAQAATRAGYAPRSARITASRLLTNDNIIIEIDERIKVLQMDADEATIRMADAARFDVSKYLNKSGRLVSLDLEALKADGLGWIIKGLKYTPQGGPIYELWDSQRALEKIHHQHTGPATGREDDPIHTVNESRIDRIAELFERAGTDRIRTATRS
jgi:phage terminase small subunit